jgi:hypothetical protein
VSTSLERSMNAQRASQARWRRETDRTSATLPARQGFLRRFENEVDPEQVLPRAERQALAREARQRHMRALRARQSS